MATSTTSHLDNSPQYTAVIKLTNDITTPDPNAAPTDNESGFLFTIQNEPKANRTFPSPVMSNWKPTTEKCRRKIEVRQIHDATASCATKLIFIVFLGFTRVLSTDGVVNNERRSSIAVPTVSCLNVFDKSRLSFRSFLSLLTIFACNAEAAGDLWLKLPSYAEVSFSIFDIVSVKLGTAAQNRKRAENFKFWARRHQSNWDPGIVIRDSGRRSFCQTVRRTNVHTLIVDTVNCTS